MGVLDLQHIRLRLDLRHRSTRRLGRTAANQELLIEADVRANHHARRCDQRRNKSVSSSASSHHRAMDLSEVPTVQAQPKSYVAGDDTAHLDVQVGRAAIPAICSVRSTPRTNTHFCQIDSTP